MCLGPSEILPPCVIGPISELFCHRCSALAATTGSSSNSSSTWILVQSHLLESTPILSQGAFSSGIRHFSPELMKVPGNNLIFLQIWFHPNPFITFSTEIIFQEFRSDCLLLHPGILYWLPHIFMIWTPCLLPPPAPHQLCYLSSFHNYSEAAFFFFYFIKILSLFHMYIFVSPTFPSVWPPLLLFLS